MPAGRPPKYKTPEEMQRVIDDYFAKDGGGAWVQLGDKELFRPTISGLAFELDMTTETLRTYGEDDKFSATVKKAKQRVEMALEQSLHGQAVTGIIFNLKNNFGWKDKSEQEITGKGGGPVETKSTINFIPVSNK